VEPARAAGDRRSASTARRCEVGESPERHVVPAPGCCAPPTPLPFPERQGFLRRPFLGLLRHGWVLGALPYVTSGAPRVAPPALNAGAPLRPRRYSAAAARGRFLGQARRLGPQQLVASNSRPAGPRTHASGFKLPSRHPLGP
jgi:hypothetical protein